MCGQMSVGGCGRGVCVGGGGLTPSGGWMGMMWVGRKGGCGRGVGGWAHIVDRVWAGMTGGLQASRWILLPSVNVSRE